MTLLEEIQDSKSCELLGSLEADNQQPSLVSNNFKGSETRSESHVDNNSSTSAGHLLKDDDIVRATAITSI